MRLARLARRASSLSAPTWVNEDPQFWDDVAKGVDALPASALGRFDEFCERFRDRTWRAAGADPEEMYADPDASGQYLRPHGHFPGLTARPVWRSSCGERAEGVQADAFAWVAPVEAGARAVEAELAAWLATPVAERRDAVAAALRARGDADGEASEEEEDAEDGDADDDWSGDFFSGRYGEDYNGIALARAGVETGAGLAGFAATRRLLGLGGGAAEAAAPPVARGGTRGLVFFARQAAGSGVPLHSDGVNYLLTGHLGLRVPPGGAAACGIEVGGATEPWADGRCLVVQTSFRHRTWNHADAHARVILYFDLWHPELTAEERVALGVFERARQAHTRRLQREVFASHAATLGNLLSRMNR